MLIWLNEPSTTSYKGLRTYLFLDRDGIINADQPDYIKRFDEFHPYPDALQALAKLNFRHIPVVVVSNQSGLGRGLIRWNDFWEIHYRMVETITKHGGAVSAALYCPHPPETHCSCRKPKPGMLIAAARMLGIDMAKSAMIGDRMSDMDAARAVGCRPILVDRSPDGTALPENPPTNSSISIFPDLQAAAQGIIT